MTTTLVQLQPQHLTPATELLTDAFADDPGMLSICGKRSPKRTRRALAGWFRATLHATLVARQPAWVVIEDDQLAGIAFGSTPGVLWPIHAWVGWLVTVGGQCGWSTVWQTMHHDQARAAYRLSHSHTVLEFLAVRAGRRGQGHGALLVEAIHRWSDAQPGRGGVWLETTRPERIPWFGKRGYALTGHLTLRSGAKAYVMYRTAPGALGGQRAAT